MGDVHIKVKERVPLRVLVACKVEKSGKDKGKDSKGVILSRKLLSRR
jgi:hypothetical protein